MNLILLFPEEVSGDHVTLTDQRAEHIRTVLRSTEGDQLRVGVLNGPIGTATVESVARSNVSLRLDLHGPVPPIPPTALILALPRPIMLKRVLAQATALGVARIFLINANRVEKSFFQASLLQDKAYESALIQGLEQAVDTRLPEVTIHQRFRPFVEDILPAYLADYPVRLIAHPNAAAPLPEVAPVPLAEQTILAIGPEGGWVDFELDRFTACGFQGFTLGPRILRVDSAVPALLAQLELLRRMAPRAS
ncbi:MAG: 16S rRNA (uracil(1498)-N(3))-methyltransferase [Thermodesulfobacteriota bacterium]